VVRFRRDYRQSLILLIQRYSASGDNRRLNWAKEELEALDRMPQYRYIIDPDVLPSNLKATARIPEADRLYDEAVNIQRQAEPLGAVLKDEEQLRVALDKYTELIRRYPTSDKIDDAAFRAAGIYEYFKDYETALLFYKRTYEWDPSTPYPAMYYAAELLDKKLGRRDQALALYQEAITKESGHNDLRAAAERRIKELTSPEN
jgi:tetratricopeptide (TPR) repeat protein